MNWFYRNLTLVDSCQRTPWKDVFSHKFFPIFLYSIVYCNLIWLLQVIFRGSTCHDLTWKEEDLQGKSCTEVEEVFELSIAAALYLIVASQVLCKMFCRSKFHIVLSLLSILAGFLRAEHELFPERMQFLMNWTLVTGIFCLLILVLSVRVCVNCASYLSILGLCEGLVT